MTYDIGKLRKTKVQWEALCSIDSKLTSLQIDRNGRVSHKIFAHERDNCVENALVEAFLEDEYRKAAVDLEFKEVTYLPSDNFTQLGVFAKVSFPVGSMIPGLTGILSEMNREDIIEGVNDFSIMESLRLKSVADVGSHFLR